MRCLSCDVDLGKEAHCNRRRCEPCATAKRQRPAHTLTDAQQQAALHLRKSMRRKAVAKAIGSSVANLARFARDNKLSFAYERYSKELKAEVISHYEDHGIASVRENYPGIRPRSIIERSSYAPRLLRWKDDEVRRAVLLAGLASKQQVADYFNRPNANAGSIQSLWAKRLKMPAGAVHGISLYTAGMLFKPGVPTVTLPGWNGNPYKKYIVLWSESVDYLVDETPQPLREAFAAMADFQRWLFRGKDARVCIEEIMRRLRDNESFS